MTRETKARFMRLLELTEGQPSSPVQLTEDEARALSECELGVVSRGPGAQAWDVQAGRKVGVARIGDLQIGRASCRERVSTIV